MASLSPPCVVRNSAPILPKENSTIFLPHSQLSSLACSVNVKLFLYPPFFISFWRVRHVQAKHISVLNLRVPAIIATNGQARLTSRFHFVEAPGSPPPQWNKTTLYCFAFFCFWFYFSISFVFPHCQYSNFVYYTFKRQDYYICGYT